MPAGAYAGTATANAPSGGAALGKRPKRSAKRTGSPAAAKRGGGSKSGGGGGGVGGGGKSAEWHFDGADWVRRSTGVSNLTVGAASTPARRARLFNRTRAGLSTKPARVRGAGNGVLRGRSAKAAAAAMASAGAWTEADYTSFWTAAWRRANQTRRDTADQRLLRRFWPKVFVYELPPTLCDVNVSNMRLADVLGKKARKPAPVLRRAPGSLKPWLGFNESEEEAVAAARARAN
eukprot:2923024-Prymnesium_polylepis.2